MLSRFTSGSVAGALILTLTPAYASPATNAPSPNDPCSLLTTSQIVDSTGLQVAEGQKGLPIPGAIGSCWWQASDGSRIVVTVADTPHMEVTMQSQVQAGADELPELGTSAVGAPGTSETESGYNISVLDSHGGVAVSILGKNGTGDKTLALAKVVEQSRAKAGATHARR